jgi:hypothetical protein
MTEDTAVELPPATPNPCSDCPWRTNSVPGWLGPCDADEWVAIAASDTPIACHQTIDEGAGEGDWTQPGIRQCAGAASFRRHIFKMPRDPEVVVGLPNPNVFARAQAFIDHHRRSTS